MTGDDPYAERKKLTFEQAEGAEPLPSQLKLKELSQELRAILWRVVSDNLLACRRFPDYAPHARLDEPWLSILRDMYTFRYHRMQFENDADVLIAEVKRIFEQGDYVAVFGWLQWVLRKRDCPYNLLRQIDAALHVSRAAYRVLEERTIVPIGSDAELETLKRAFADLAVTEFHGARALSAMPRRNLPGATAPIASARAFMRWNRLSAFSSPKVIFRQPWQGSTQKREFTVD